MNLISEIIFAIENPDVLHSSQEYRRMLRDVLSMERDFATDADAKAWTELNPYATARVIEKNTHVMSYHGSKVPK